MLASRSSSTNTAIWSPFLVNLRVSPVITPPMLHRRPVAELGEVADRLLDLAPQRRLDPEQRVVGHVQPEHLLLVAQLVGLVELDVGDRQPLVERRRRRRRPSASPPQSPNRLITPCSRSRRRVSVVSVMCSNTPSRPLRVWPSESKAPALISDSTARLLSTGSGTRSAKSWKLANGPLASRSSSSRATRPAPTLRTADSPNVIAPGAADRQRHAVGHLARGERREVGDRAVDVRGRAPGCPSPGTRRCRRPPSPACS